MDYTDKLNKFYQIVLIPIKLVVPIAPTDLFKTLGVGMIGLLLLPYKKNKNLILIILFFALSFAVLQNYQNRWLLPLLIFICIFVEEIKGHWFKKITYFQFISVSLCLIPFVFTIAAGDLIPAINKNNSIYTIKKISEQINQKYQHIKYFTNSNYFYYHDNDIPVYYPEINSLFDKDFFNRNKEIKFFLFKGSEDIIFDLNSSSRIYSF